MIILARTMDFVGAPLTDPKPTAGPALGYSYSFAKASVYSGADCSRDAGLWVSSKRSVMYVDCWPLTDLV